MKTLLLWAMIVVPVCAVASYLLTLYAVDWVSKHPDQFDGNPVPAAYLLTRHAENPLLWLFWGIPLIFPALLLVALMLYRNVRPRRLP